MDSAALLRAYNLFATPGIFAGLAAFAVFLIWMAFAPARRRDAVGSRLDGYVDRPDAPADEMAQPFVRRVILPGLRRLLKVFSRMAPQRNAEMTRTMLLQAGRPLGLSVADFFGVRMLAAIIFALLVFVAAARAQGMSRAIIFAAVGFGLGFLLPVWWLNYVVKKRKHRIQRALPDALDMLTIGVEAGLGFDSALLRVGEKWRNPLTSEFNRTVAEMRVGTPRDAALGRMVERCGVSDLTTFVAVLVQSSQLGVSIAQVLHQQAAEMRLRRRQRAEELGRQAGIKMLFPLVLFIFPAMFVVILGPAVPSIMAGLNNTAASMGR